jgi:hypothetical protein
MADQSASTLFTSLQHNPGNPVFPTLPGAGDPNVGYLGAWGTGASLLYPFFEDQTDVVQSASGTGKVGFGAWYLDNIWVTPTPLDFGDIPDDKNLSVTLFSSYLEPVTLDSVDIPVSGLDITAPAGSPLFPTSLPSFTDSLFTFTATQAGPQTFDDDITFTVNGVPFEVRTVGRRVLLLFAEPQNGGIEQLVFATDLMRAKNGTEQAFSLRLAPYSQIQYTLRHDGSLDYQRMLIEALLVGGNPLLPYGMQLWYEAEKITSAAGSGASTVNIDTRYMQIEAGNSFVFTTPNRVNVIAEIDSFTDTDITFTQPIGTALPLDTYGMPVRFGHLVGPPQLTTARYNLQDTDIKLRTEEDNDISNVDANYFDFHTVESPARPIIKKRCLQGTSSRGLIYRETQELDGVTGRLFVTGTEPLGEWISDVIVHCNSKPEIWAWREFLHYVRGSWGTFYLPSFQNDLPLNERITLGGNTFEIPYMGIEAFFNAAAPYRDLRIQLDDGTFEYKRITDVTDNGNGTETVTVDSVIGSAGFSEIDGTMISFMRLCRIEGDTAQFTHLYLGEARLQFTVRTVKE